MDVASYFKDFIANVKSRPVELDEMQREQLKLRALLEKDDVLGPLIISTFLHGSHRRATANKAATGKKADIDVIAVTRLNPTAVSPKQALGHFVPFLQEHYRGKWEAQGRSFGITFEHVKVDLVPTAEPPKVDLDALRWRAVTGFDTPETAPDWRLTPSWLPLADRSQSTAAALLRQSLKEKEWTPGTLLIPDREVNKWEQTNPIRQIQWTWAKNAKCGGRFVDVVKSLKWWRTSCRPTPKYPRSYPLENLIGVSCQDGIASVAAGVTLVLEDIAQRYAEDVSRGAVPFVPDHGIPENNVLARVTAQDFAGFHGHVCEAAKLARAALDSEELEDSVEKWRKLFGEEFPAPPKREGASTGGFTPRTAPSVIGGRRFA